MALVALTNINHANADGEPVFIDAGSDVKESDFSKEQWDQLKADGAVGVPPAKAEEVADENERLRAQLADVQRQLAAAQKQTTEAPKSPATK